MLKKNLDAHVICISDFCTVPQYKRGLNKSLKRRFM